MESNEQKPEGQESEEQKSEEQKVELQQIPFTIEVTSEKSVPIDFTGHEGKEICIMLCELTKEGENVKVPSGEVKVYVSTKEPQNTKHQLGTFSPEDTNEKLSSFISTAENEPTLIVEGPETIIVSGVYMNPSVVEGEEEEEEEEEEKEEKEEKE